MRRADQAGALVDAPVLPWTGRASHLAAAVSTPPTDEDADQEREHEHVEHVVELRGHGCEALMRVVRARRRRWTSGMSSTWMDVTVKRLRPAPDATTGKNSSEIRPL